MTKNVTKTKRSRKCRTCGGRLPKSKRGRPQAYCCPSHRQRAYVKRGLASAAERVIPQLLLGRDIDDMRTRAGMERVIVDTLRKLGLLPPQPTPPRPPPLQLVKAE